MELVPLLFLLTILCVCAPSNPIITISIHPCFIPIPILSTRTHILLNVNIYNEIATVLCFIISQLLSWLALYLFSPYVLPLPYQFSYSLHSIFRPIYDTLHKPFRTSCVFWWAPTRILLKNLKTVPRFCTKSENIGYQKFEGAVACGTRRSRNCGFANEHFNHQIFYYYGCFFICS